MVPGEVWLVGAGPGDPELLTLRGYQLLRQADVIVHDRLGCEELLQAVSEKTRLIDVGKAPGAATVPQSRINEILEEEAREGNRVLRLKGGDPFVFGRGMEEALHLRERGIACHVVPGISSSLAAPAAAGIPVTHRAVARGFAVGTGRAEEGHVPNVVGADTRIFLMGLGALEEIVAQLLAGGVQGTTPAAIVTNATTYRQQVVRGTVATIGEPARTAQLAPPGVLVVGPTAALTAAGDVAREVVFVTSSRVPPLLASARPDAVLLWRPVSEWQVFEGAARRAARLAVRGSLAAHWLLFSNHHAVREYLAMLLESGNDVRAIKARIAAVGTETVAALHEMGIVADIAAIDGQRDGLVEALAALGAGTSVAMPGGDGAASGLAAELSARGAAINAFPVYEVRQRAASRIEWRFVQSVFFASPGAVRRFVELYPEAPLGALRAICVGDSPAILARGLGFAAVEDLANKDTTASAAVYRQKDQAGQEAAS